MLAQQKAHGNGDVLGATSAVSGDGGEVKAASTSGGGGGGDDGKRVRKRHRRHHRSSRSRSTSADRAAGAVGMGDSSRIPTTGGYYNSTLSSTSAAPTSTSLPGGFADERYGPGYVARFKDAPYPRNFHEAVARRMAAAEAAAAVASGGDASSFSGSSSSSGGGGGASSLAAFSGGAAGLGEPGSSNGSSGANFNLSGGGRGGRRTGGVRVNAAGVADRDEGYVGLGFE